MDKIFVQGREKLYGSIKISGMKNSALPILFATLLVKGESIIDNIPVVNDVHNTLKILSDMGADIKYESVHSVRINTKNIDPDFISMNLVSKMRASSYLMGVLLALFGRARIAYPGGCNFGHRPIDEHLKGFRKMGAKCIEYDGYVEITTEEKLKSGKITLDKISVGATINMILASVFTEGTTVVENIATEPHVDDVIGYLCSCGAQIKREGSTVKIVGVKSLKGTRYSIYPDTIEALTYISCVGVTSGVLEIKNTNLTHVMPFLPTLSRMGYNIEHFGNDIINVRSSGKLKGADVVTAPYPSFPTDFHPQFASLLCNTSDGGSIVETVFPNRFAYVGELKKMGARVDKIDNKVVIKPSMLDGCSVDATDLRAGAALIVASLYAYGESIINNVTYILRGYEDIVGKLSSVGAIIKIV